MDSIQLSHIYKTFPIGEQQHTIFKNLNLDIPLGQITVLVGRSGCGKSTLLRLLGGEIQPDSGSITMPAHYRSTMLYPEPYLISWTSVLNNIALASGVDYTPEARDEKARRIMKLVQLEKYEAFTPTQLSTGMKQRLGLARALASAITAAFDGRAVCLAGFLHPCRAAAAAFKHSGRHAAHHCVCHAPVGGSHPSGTKNRGSAHRRHPLQLRFDHRSKAGQPTFKRANHSRMLKMRIA